jgi:hypothetical protein
MSGSRNSLFQATLKFVVGMHQILEEKAEILFLSLPNDSTAIQTQVEHILPNAAGTSL